MVQVVCSDESRLLWKIQFQITTFLRQWHNIGTLEEQIGEGVDIILIWLPI